MAQIGIRPDRILPADIDETPVAKELPRDHAMRLAREKAETAIKLLASENGRKSYVLAADTVVGVGRRILPKAEDASTARKCLKLLSGRGHRVYGGVALRLPNGEQLNKLVVTSVKFKRLSADELETYISSGEWDGKAGGYAIQGRAAMFVQRISGSYSNVVGLPLFEAGQLLKGAGYRW